MWQALFGLAMKEAWKSDHAIHRPSARNRSTHLATVFGVVLNWRAAAAMLSPPSITNRTMASRPFGVRGAFLWLFIWSLRGTLKLRNLSFLGSDQMDNLLKDHI
jgi:hypothetical protein